MNKQKIVEILSSVIKEYGDILWTNARRGGYRFEETFNSVDCATMCAEALLPHMEPRIPKDVRQFLQEHQQLVEDFVGFDCPIRPEYWDGDDRRKEWLPDQPNRRSNGDWLIWDTGGNVYYVVNWYRGNPKGISLDRRIKDRRG